MCMDCFLGYLEEWQNSVDTRTTFTKGQKKMMCLSRETLDGLKITGIEDKTAIFSACNNLINF